MGLFSSPSGYLGIDIGNHSIKIVELRNEKGRPRLATYGFSDQKLDITKTDSAEMQAKTAKIIQEICKEAKTKSVKIVASLPSFSVFSSIISLPKMSKKDLVSAIRWEAKKVIPLPLEEMILDWRILDEEANGEPKGKKPPSARPDKNKKNTRLLLTGASKNLVSSYMKIFKAAGLSLLSLEPESFALIRSLVGHDKATVIIINIGDLTTNVSIVEEGVPFMNRSIDMGGQAITRSISNSLNISPERAEQFKKDVGLSGSGGAVNTIPKTIEESVSTIVNEIKYTIGLYQNQSNKRVEKIVLAGGAAMLSGLSAHLSSVLDINTYVGDPWARVVYPVELKPVLNEIGSRMAVAIGLAMRDIV